jgi:predicted RNA methylase
MPATAKVNGAKTAAKFRTMAATVAKAVADRRVPRDDNTPKRNLQGMCRRIEADHLERVKIALDRLADAHEAGTVPEPLAGIKSKAELMKMLSTKTNHPSYYVVTDTREFHDTSETAVALRAFLEGAKDAKAEAERAKADLIFALENKVKFSSIPGFFPTPPAIVERLMEMAHVRPGHTALEPSAGKGDIADALKAAGAIVSTIEVSYDLCNILKAKGYEPHQGDFLATVLTTQKFDRIVMNPPFEKGADIDHVRHAYSLLASGGRLVSVMSVGPFYRSDRKSEEFREWFSMRISERIDLPEDAFKTDAFRQTGTRTVMVVIDKP